MDYFEKVLKPYIVAKRKELNLPDDHKCIVISDVFKGQNTPTVVEKYKAENVILINVPPNMTHLLQPLDISVNRVIKAHMCNNFESWYASLITIQLTQGINPEIIHVDCGLKAIKELHAKWIISSNCLLKTRPDDI